MLTIRSISSFAFVAAVALAAGCGKPSIACRMRQSEAKADLNALHEAQTKFHERTGHFAVSLDELKFTAPDPNYYDVKIVSASTDTYLAQATGKRSVQGDEWTVDQLGHPIVQTNACQ